MTLHELPWLLGVSFVTGYVVAGRACWVPNLLVAELYIRHTRSAAVVPVKPVSEEAVSEERVMVCLAVTDWTTGGWNTPLCSSASWQRLSATTGGTMLAGMEICTQAALG